MISIFYRPTFINLNPNEAFSLRTKPIPKGRGHLMRVSSMIRADQIAEYIRARLNPESDYENDICIYVKPNVPNGGDFKFEGKPYLDMVDGWGLYPLMRNYPQIPVILCSKQDQEIMSKILKNKTILIPQHHCNFKREKRNSRSVTKVGVIGTAGAFPYLPVGLKDVLSKRGIELIEFSRFFSRQDVVDFYKKIDVQIVWRPYRMRLSNPLKIVNASSFGIPTIAFEESVFKEVEGCYIPVKTLEEFLENLDRLIGDPYLYESYSQRCVEKSEKYHIENIAKLYKQLT